METPAWAPARTGSETPSAARVYNYMLGGSHNFAVDRAVAEQAIAAMPAVRVAGQLNRAFLRRAVQFLIRSGIRQFIDLGAGIAAVGAVHEIAWQLDPECTVAYVDNDPVVAAYNEQILSGDARAAAVHADLRDHDAVLADPGLAAVIDLTRPVGLLMVAVLHNLPDGDDPYGVVDGYRARLAPGSFIAVSHATMPPGMPAPASDAQAQYNRTDNQLVLRAQPDVERFFTGFDLVEPGVTYADAWRPDDGDPTDHGIASLMTVAGVGQLS
ncbi:SAM-dependent methyltransferase [Dactylosporangium siamense]|uniref:S-adenosyl methyltransferase n=1 Tax=Dactylosporangium siamense TaxID=685454 RepID=A0A919PTJ0_9ACTN|nr:SAM-dependent methyltransferase [Dactylosporangium siamense]GIG50296.1 hypothetical protein Dsi01nite_083370 [Dactylosporangium siamense]